MGNQLEMIKDTIKGQEENVYQHSLTKTEMEWLIKRAELADRFEEVMKANAEGKTVMSWLDREDLPYNIHRPHYDLLGKVKINKFMLLGAEIERFNELKWTIEEDK